MKKETYILHGTPLMALLDFDGKLEPIPNTKVSPLLSEKKFGEMSGIERVLWTLGERKRISASKIFKRVIGKNVQDVKENEHKLIYKKLFSKKNKRAMQSLSRLKREGNYYYDLLNLSIRSRIKAIENTWDVRLLPGYKIMAGISHEKAAEFLIEKIFETSQDFPTLPKWKS